VVTATAVTINPTGYNNSVNINS